MTLSRIRQYAGLVLCLAFCLAAFGCSSCCQQPAGVQRYGMVIGVKPEKIEYYKYLHSHPWPTVAKKITECNIRNFAIYLREIEPGKHYLFGYFEYVGTDFAGDMKKMGDDPETQRWWKETDPCQYIIPTAKKGDKWSMMEEVFYQK